MTGVWKKYNISVFTNSINTYHTEEHDMIKILANVLNTFTKAFDNSRNTDLERFIAKHYPRSTADVEYWEKKYHQQNYQKTMWWA